MRGSHCICSFPAKQVLADRRRQSNLGILPGHCLGQKFSMGRVLFSFLKYIRYGGRLGRIGQKRGQRRVMLQVGKICVAPQVQSGIIGADNIHT